MAVLFNSVAEPRFAESKEVVIQQTELSVHVSSRATWANTGVVGSHDLLALRFHLSHQQEHRVIKIYFRWLQLLDYCKGHWK